MLDYHLNSTYAPPDPKLVEQWKRKGNPHQIALLEGKAADLMRARGYQPVGEGVSPSKIEKLTLLIEQKTFQWSFGIRRFGVALFFGEKISRKLGLRSWNQSARKRINAISQSLVK